MYVYIKPRRFKSPTGYLYANGVELIGKGPFSKFVRIWYRDLSEDHPVRYYMWALNDAPGWARSALGY